MAYGQHGIESVGYEMYQSYLRNVTELKGSALSQDIEVTIDLKINAYINDEYISSEIQKIEMYKRIASVQDEDDL